MAAADVPTAPTVPDGEPASMAMMMSQLANEMFGAPGVTPGVTPVATPVATPVSTPMNAVPMASPTPATPSPATPSPATPSPATPVASAPAYPTMDAPTSLPLVTATTAPTTDVSPFAAAPTFDHLYAPLALPSDFTSLVAVKPAGDDGAAKALRDDQPLDPLMIRHEFPILQERVHGKRLVWLDNAATTQKPQAVIDRLSYFYAHENSNIHRAAHTLAARATEAYENARESVRRFINAPSTDNIIFLRGTTEGINLIAQSWGGKFVEPGDEIIITWLEHHANIVPWQMLCKATGAKLRVAPVDDSGQIILDEYAKLFNDKTKLVAMTQVSNALGTVTPAAAMIQIAHGHGVKVMLDGAQAVSHMRVDVQALDADFFVFSGHKVFGPTGIGAVYGKREILESMPPWQGGGNMISDVTFENTTYHKPPARFEAGTGNIADAVGLGAALDWLTNVGLERVTAYEHGLLHYATERLEHVPGLTMIGTAHEKAGVLSFVLAGQNTTEVGGMLDKEGIAVRSGHHCAQPILRRFGVEATVRASLAPYNTREDIDALVEALLKIQAHSR
ncbi:MAG: SufS family cysteine desulfurase [Myxococcales bacterium]|nr:SufS family cysteine desulfurase [Myxococcales bacterium]